LAVFTKKSDPFIYRHSVGEPACAARPGHSLMRQSARNKPIVYMSERINQAADAGINAPQDGKSVFDGPEDANSRVLAQFCAWKNFSLPEPYEPAVVAYIDEPVEALLASLIYCKSPRNRRYGIFITNHYALR
jgi:hypothetical protein